MTAAEGASSEAADTVPLSAAGFDTLMPMGLILTPEGVIRHAGPTMIKLRPGDGALVGRRFLDVFEVRRPRQVAQFSDLAAQTGDPLRIQFRDAPRTVLKGESVVLADDNGLVVNLSFGIGAIDALAAYDMSRADFATSDLTVEMLYLVEANAAVQAELRRLNSRLEGARTLAQENALTDPLTGLRNRRALNEALDRYSTASAPFSVMAIDLDYFKQVNDEMGHDAGDAVLCNVARILRDLTRKSDTVVRTGGDEFVLLLHHTTERFQLEAVASRLQRRLELPIFYEGRELRVSASIGIAASTCFPKPDSTMLMRAADVALYDAKNAGRSRFAFADKSKWQGAKTAVGQSGQA